MNGPAWLSDVAAALMLAVALYAVGRVATAPLLHRVTTWDIDLAHVPMGVAMAGMFVPRLAILSWWVWGIVFGLLTAYFLVRSLVLGAGRAHYVPHTVHAGAMLYMTLALPAVVGGTGMAGMNMGSAGTGMPHLPTIAFALALFMVGYTALLAHAMGTPRLALPQDTAPRVFDPVGALAYKLVMSVVMGFMLILML